MYRAEDTKLKRQVAIKVLPEEFAQDEQRLARFEREAQLLASLNHPNIASIYGIEEADAVKALVLELVEGPTLVTERGLPSRRFFQEMEEGGRGAIYAPTGHLIYSRGETLFAVSFDVTSSKVGGVAVRLVETMQMDGLLSAGRNFAISKSGTLAYLAGDSTSNRALVWKSRDGQEQELGLPPRRYNRGQISPDGTRIVLDTAPTGQNEGNREIWIHDALQKVTQRFTSDAGADDNPIWTPDGERIIFLSERDGGGLFSKRYDGAAAVERLTPQGIGLAFTYGMSPDGRWMAYQSDETGEDNVFVRRFPDVHDGQWQVCTDGGRSRVGSRWYRAVLLSRSVLDGS